MMGSNSVTPLYTGKIRATGEWHLPAHAHEFEEFVIVLEGSEKVVTQRDALVAPRGTVLFFPRGVLHEEWAHECESLVSIFIAFSVRSPYERAMPSLVFDRDDRLLPMAQWFLSEQKWLSAKHTELAVQILSTFFLEYRRLGSVTENKLVATVREHVHSNIAEPITLEDLARVAGLSKSHFSQIYHELTGVTPMSDVRRIRLEEARQMLMDTQYFLKEIAARLGFADSHHLARLLKNHFGTGAKELRKAGVEKVQEKPNGPALERVGF